jgi:hypothetical protein
MSALGSTRRDRLVRNMHVARWAAGLGAAGLTAAFTVAAAHAFKGHDGHTRAAKVSTRSSAHARVAVPGPDRVPSIASDGSLQPPEQAPQAAPPAPQQEAPAQPPVSGGS